jgi:uncharacterized membrane protein YidH (DUF202 family)
MATELGMSLIMPAATAALMEVAPDERDGLASSRPSFVPGLRTGMVIASAAFAIGAILSTFGIGRNGGRS